VGREMESGRDEPALRMLEGRGEVERWN